VNSLAEKWQRGISARMKKADLGQSWYSAGRKVFEVFNLFGY
jgi:hypothetical protein